MSCPFVWLSPTFSSVSLHLFLISHLEFLCFRFFPYPAFLAPPTVSTWFQVPTLLLGTVICLRSSQPLQVYVIAFWMAHYLSRTPKRTKLWSSNPLISRFHKGVLRKKDREALRDQSDAPPPCRSYHNAEGAKKFRGTCSLKGTECDPELIAPSRYEQFRRLNLNM